MRIFSWNIICQMKREVKLMSTKKICINAMGIALFVVLTLCLQVPVFENYYLCLGYIVMAFYTYYFGTVSGTLVGTIGVLIYCVLTGGFRGMPGWVFANIVIGIVCGITVVYMKKYHNRWLQQGVMIISVVVSTTIGILGVKSLTEVLLYGIPFATRIVNNIFAFTADMFVLIFGFEICISGESIFKNMVRGLNYE